MKLVFYEVEDWQRKVMREAFPDWEMVFVQGPMDTSNWEIALGADILSVFVDSRVTGDIIEKLDGLKMIATRSTGFDHIDLASAKTKGLVVSNVPTYGENTVAEHAMALLLALTRKIPQTINQTRTGDFSLEKLRGFDLKGKRLGIYGLGSIGQHLARMAKGFEMELYACTRHPEEEFCRQYGITVVDTIDELLGIVDVLSFHVPHTKETHHLINKENIGKIKPGMIIINTSRGELIDTEALVEALNSNVIDMAGLDVLEEEKSLKEQDSMMSSGEWRDKTNLTTLMEDHLLIGREDVLFTAHNAFNSKEAVERILSTTIENIQAYLDSRSQNLV